MGKKKIFKILNKLIFLLKFRYNISISPAFFLNLYLKQVFYNMRPIIYFKYKHVRGERELLPWLLKKNNRQDKKYISLAIIWIRRAVKMRKEKSLLLRIYSEFADIRLNKGNAINAKKIFYLDFYNSRVYQRILKFIEWV